MTGIWFPGLTIPEVKITAGRFLNISLLGLGIKVPPVDIIILPKITIWSGFKLFDTDWIVWPLAQLVTAVPKAVWDLCKSTLDSWAEDYYKRHSEEEK